MIFFRTSSTWTSYCWG